MFQDSLVKLPVTNTIKYIYICRFSDVFHQSGDLFFDAMKNEFIESTHFIYRRFSMLASQIKFLFLEINFFTITITELCIKIILKFTASSYKH